MKPTNLQGYIMTGLSVLVMSLGGFWFTTTAKGLSESEVRAVVRQESPYLEDKKALQQAIQILQDLGSDDDARLKEIDTRLRHVEEQLARIEVLLERR